MIKLGITGGIGSGKSIVSRVLNAFNIPIYIADNEAKRLMVEDPFIRESLINLLGSEVYLKNQLNKKKVADFLFDNPENALIINNIVHPQVKRDFLMWCNTNSMFPVVGIESAILFDAKFHNLIDYSILVYAPQKVRIERAIKRDNSTLELITKRIAAQSSDSEFMDLVDYLILNDSKTALLPQIIELTKDIKCK